MVKTPQEILSLFEKIGRVLGKNGYILRSGGANGADSAFEKGCDTMNAQKQIFLPWKDFNGNKSKYFYIKRDAYDLTKKFHSNWDRITKDSVKKLLARNSYQVLGYDLNTSSDFIICYTKDGMDIGGISQTLRIARDHEIPIYNFGNREDMMRFYNDFKDL